MERSMSVTIGGTAPNPRRVGSRRSDPATAIGAPRADTNRGFRVGRSIFDATHAGVFVVPVAPAKAMVLPRWLQGRLARSRDVRRGTGLAAEHRSLLVKAAAATSARERSPP